MSKELLSNEERARLETAITAAEKGTQAELVPVVTRASDSYPGARWRVAVAFALGVGTAIIVILPELDTLYVWVGLAPLLILGHFLAALPPVLRLALSSNEVAEEVHQRALERFFENGLHLTRDRDGVLLFISLLERRIEILADKEIDARAPEGFWDDIVAGLVRRLRAGELVPGLEEALERCGDLLAEHFPRREKDENEIPDRVIIDS